jgi:hypothetical protein
MYPSYARSFRLIPVPLPQSEPGIIRVHFIMLLVCCLPIGHPERPFIRQREETFQQLYLRNDLLDIHTVSSNNLFFRLLRLGLRTSEPHQYIIGCVLDASIIFVEQANRLECLVAQLKSVFCLQRIKDNI